MHAQFSEQEFDYYRGVFSQVDAAGSGRVSGVQAAGFLFTSGLDRKVLKQIWDLADSSAEGSLGLNEFGVALRLVAHAQAGRTISEDLIYQEPPVAPRFDGSASQGSPGPPPSDRGGGGGGSQRRGRSPPPGEDRQLPTARDLRKYGRLFYARVVLNGRMTMSADEAKELFERSGLATDVLQQVWYIADHDSDGQLSWPEFVLAMHLIRRALAGQAMPPPQVAVSRELGELLGSLMSPEEYARQPSRSPRSLSGSSTPFGSTTLDLPPVQAEPPSDFQVPPNGSFSQPPPQPSGFEATPNWGGGGFDDGFAAPPETPRSKRASSTFTATESEASRRPTQDFQERMSTQDFQDVGFGGFGSEPSGFDPLPAPSHRFSAAPPSLADETNFPPVEEPLPRSSGRRSSRRDEDQHSVSHSPDFGERTGHDAFESRLSVSLTGEQPVEHLEVLIEAEKKLVHRLRRDTDVLDEELTRLEEACREEERAATREKAECDRMGRERDILLQQLEASQRQLNELKAEHKGLHIESVLLRRDTDHYSKEVAFLQRLLDEATRDAQVLQQSIEYFDRSNQSLTAHTKALEEARQDVLSQVKMEREMLKKEEQEALLAKTTLETLRPGVGGDPASAYTASRLPPATEVQGPSDFGRMTRPATEPAPWFAGGGFGSLPDTGGNGFFSDMSIPPTPTPSMGKEYPGGGRPLNKVPAAFQLREGV